MDRKTEIKKTEEAIDTIQEFIQNHIDGMDSKTLSKWADARKGFVEELYYMRRSVENE